ncbi:M15 family metallopeptidase [Streptomyces sp. TRM66268-LWL]|uniref:M15 family metallopeptidase n=1 Tax=Streptomyces polyasparticus TaxID=2767826 RepID=A0ABR7SW63_9ACTN|nr:M15 family metallopeptidase [Streptomyces polyasparticus]MBC9719019.1 M15 family metallopeptidase [Streptomyces polyasparticus]
MNHSDISAVPAPHSAPRPARRRPALRAAVAAVIAGATLTGLAGCQSSPTSSSFTQVSPTPSASATSAAPEPSASEPSASKPPAPPGKRADHRPLGEQDGRVPDGVTVFDEHIAAVANLDPALLTALQRAASDARLTFTVNSGWRSADYQEELLRKAVAQYGSEEEAARWVATAQNSPHVSGEAIDLGPSAAQTWLSRHGAAYGLCQIYRNEPWHYELRPQAVTAGCPAMYADPTEDPRMR